MATANEKKLANILHDVITHVMGLIDDDPSLESLLKLQEETAKIIMEDESKCMSWNDRYYYDGCNLLDLKPEERPTVCEFVITHYNKVVMRLYYDRNLEWILQPNGNGFSPACRRPLCGRAQLRNYLAKLAKAEEAEPGAYAKKYYLPANYLGAPIFFKDEPKSDSEPESNATDNAELKVV